MTRRGSILPRSFFARPVQEVARDLLGAVLVRVRDDDRLGRVWLAGRIVETEAYDGPSDRACHASRGRTPRTDVMFGPPGHAYIYIVYGMHYCLNVVTGPAGYPAAVLLRAVEPIEGIERMGGRRTGPERIAAGPGRLTRALHIGRHLNRTDLCAPGALFIEGGTPVPPGAVVTGRRIGVEYAGAWARKPWRFGVLGSPFLSRPFAIRRRGS